MDFLISVSTKIVIIFQILTYLPLNMLSPPLKRLLSYNPEKLLLLFFFKIPGEAGISLELFSNYFSLKSQVALHLCSKSPSLNHYY